MRYALNVAGTLSNPDTTADRGRSAGQREHRAVVRVRLLCSETEGTVRLSVQWDRGNTGL